MKKKILLYTDTTLVGGAELQMFLLAKFLDKNSFTPILACSQSKTLDKWCDNFTKEDITVIRINATSKHHPTHYFQLKKIIKEHQIDLLHIHVWNPASNRYAFLLRNTPVLITEHDPFKLSKIKTIYKKYSLKKTSSIITVSEQNSSLIKELYPQHAEKTQVILNGIDIDWWKSQLRPIKSTDILKTRRNIFKCHENTFIITTIATLHSRKGIHHLIQSLPTVTQEFPNTKLVIIGTGPELQPLINLSKKLSLENHIIFLGKRKEIPLLLKSSNIFVLPSEREAFGLVLLEAMISGLPIIATSVGGIPEIIKNDYNGILVPPKSPEALTSAIIRTIKDPELCSQLTTNGLTTITQQYNANKMAQQYQEVYNQLLKPKS
ncbi:hypothetical protein CVV38_03575 [Candidatus Peregrinibacteria bacterium HGW-Peregrinibacteria-1]|jgi:glycosyltransferase involved in cell wall biosynthesis|nr:MAG: hypothetical protein CVV38_03575 [Candidatus Peregrinibacteria bacterium HGW-Peregrinibacteria-1]